MEGVTKDHVGNWEVMGIFSDEDAAVKGCSEDREFIMGPFELGVRLPDKMTQAPISYYPRLDIKR